MIGFCGLNNLRLFMNPNDYKLILKVESSLNDEILLDKDYIEIKIDSCDPGQYNLYDRNNILTCENPICYDSCPINSTAKCVISDNNIYEENNIKHNICKCDIGWTGELCNQKDFINFR